MRDGRLAIAVGGVMQIVDDTANGFQTMVAIRCPFS
jgi:hypothetical protein